jgi:FemAB-related protein (PEP-CTERM system-associated)
MNADGLKITPPAAVYELDDVMARRWDAFVDTSPEASFFHRAGWRDVIERSFGHRTHYLYALRDDRVVGVLPIVEIKSALFGHALISNGFSVCGGPAAADEGTRALLDLRAEEIFRRTGADYLEYRCPVRTKHGWLTRDDLYAGFCGPLAANEADNLKQIPRKQRAVVRKAIDSDLTWNIEDNVDNLYRLYALSVRNLGTPVFAKRYFQNLLSVFAGDADVLTVFHQGEPVASVLSFYFKGSVMPFYTGSVPTARRLGANDLMYWRLMRHAVGRGCSIFDFGRSKVGTGPYDFKRNWGFAPTPLVHQYLTRPGYGMPNVNPTNPKYRAMIAAWKRLPLGVANAIGPYIVRNIG